MEHAGAGSSSELLNLFRVGGGHEKILKWRCHRRPGRRGYPASRRRVSARSRLSGHGMIARRRRALVGAVAFVVLELRLPAARGKSPDVPKWGWGVRDEITGRPTTQRAHTE